MSDSNTLFIHSKCCRGHWVIRGCGLVCPGCGMHAGGIGLAFSMPPTQTSECCDAQYELVLYKDGRWAILCEACDKENRSVVVTGPDLHARGRGCEECRRKDRDQ